MYIERKISEIILESTKQFPITFLTGPRQSGKTTLLKHLFPEYKYVNFEDPELRQWAIEDPKDFLNHHSFPAILDEVQNIPGLFSYLQLIVDNNNVPGQFILSGSQNFLLMKQVSQTLAGRSAVLSLLPFSYEELIMANYSYDTDEVILKGFYPRLYQTVNNVDLFYKSYVNTYVERDIRTLSNIGSVNDFIRFMKLCAGRTGELLNISSLANETGISYNTCKSWLSYLSASYVIHLVQPYFRNFNKRIVKSPKLFFLDTGLLTFLLGVRTVDTLAIHPFRGNIFENLVFTELLKSRYNSGKESNIWFWRDNHGTEIDFLLEKENELICIEVKSGMNFQNSYLKNINKLKKYNPKIDKSYLVYNGQIERQILGTQLINWRDISKQVK